MRINPSRPHSKRQSLLGLAGLIAAGIVGVIHSTSYAHAQQPTHAVSIIKIEPTQDLGVWQGWGSSLAWWAKAIGGTANADYYADLIYTRKNIAGYPGLGLNIVRYNVGGGGINQPTENKGPKLQWQMDIHGYWTNPVNRNPATWSWSVDQNQRAMMRKAEERGANLFEMFSDSPMWWMNFNHSTAGSDSGGDCLRPEDYDQFAFYLASVARYTADHWKVRFTAVEPFNEPSANWWKFPGRQEGCHFDAATQQEIIPRLRKALDRAHLPDVQITAADENNMDAGLSTWRSYTPQIRREVGFVSVHGYSNGTSPYHGAGRRELRRSFGSKPVWMSEYGDGDASGYTMARQIIRDVKDLRPSAWVYWQPVEPDAPGYGWGFINAKYVNTHDRTSAEKTPLVRINRKFLVYGQFTRYLRSGYHMIGIEDPNAIAAYSRSLHQLVFVVVTGQTAESLTFGLSNFSSVDDKAREIATTTAPGIGVPDWRAHVETLAIKKQGSRYLLAARLYPKSIYTFVITARR